MPADAVQRFVHSLPPSQYVLPPGSCCRAGCLCPPVCLATAPAAAPWTTSTPAAPSPPPNNAPPLFAPGPFGACWIPPSAALPSAAPVSFATPFTSFSAAPLSTATNEPIGVDTVEPIELDFFMEDIFRDGTPLLALTTHLSPLAGCLPSLHSPRASQASHLASRSNLRPLASPLTFNPRPSPPTSDLHLRPPPLISASDLRL